MMENYKEKTLKDALEAVSLRELPRRYDDSSDGIWIEAVALVRKADCTQSYALVRRRGDGLISMTRDFGRMSPLAGIVSVHPYRYLDKKRFLTFRDEEDKARFLHSCYGNFDFSGVSDEKREVMLVDAAIRAQLRDEDNDRLANEMDERAVEKEAEADAKTIVGEDGLSEEITPISDANTRRETGTERRKKRAYVRRKKEI